MKKLFLIILLVNNLLNSQNQLKVDYLVTYNRLSYIERHATLFINDKISVFNEKMDTSKEIKREIVDDVIDDNTLKFDVKYNDRYYKYSSETKEIVFVDNIIMVGDFIVYDKFPNINWQLESETKIISNLKCYKATGVFRGRKWNAWYSPEIPFSTGSWKLNGLPGLILEVYDEDKKFSFVATSIKYGVVENLDIPTDNLKKMDFQTFIETKEEMPYLKTDLNRDESVKINFPRAEELKYEWEE